LADLGLFSADVSKNLCERYFNNLLSDWDEIWTQAQYQWDAVNELKELRSIHFWPSSRDLKNMKNYALALAAFGLLSKNWCVVGEVSTGKSCNVTSLIVTDRLDDAISFASTYVHVYACMVQ
jgi:hypothetical protein